MSRRSGDDYTDMKSLIDEYSGFDEGESSEEPEKEEMEESGYGSDELPGEGEISAKEFFGEHLEYSDSDTEKLMECYDDLLPAIADCFLSWDYETGKPEAGKALNKVRNVESKMSGDHSVDKVSRSLRKLEEAGYIGFSGIADDNKQYDFGDVNVYDLFDLHRELDELEESIEY